MNLKTSHALIVALMVTLGSILFVGWWEFPEMPQQPTRVTRYPDADGNTWTITDMVTSPYTCSTGTTPMGGTQVVCRVVGATK